MNGPLSKSVSINVMESRSRVRIFNLGGTKNFLIRSVFSRQDIFTFLNLNSTRRGWGVKILLAPFNESLGPNNAASRPAVLPATTVAN